jgi:HAD domain in Swiss Army Knife RNA repair proteins
MIRNAVSDVDSLAARISALPVGSPVGWFLDVDGVLNLEAGAAGISDWPTYRSAVVETCAGESVRLTWAPDLVDCLNLLVSLGHVEIRWLTSWRMDAPLSVAAALGLHVGHRVICPRSEDTGWWKLLAVQETVGDEFFVWTDDYLSDAAVCLDGALLVAPHPAHGLTPGELHRIVEAIGSQRRWAMRCR